MVEDSIIAAQTATSLLRRIHFFDGLSIEELEFLSHLVSARDALPREIIFHQGDAPDAFYVIVSGEIEIVLEVPGEEPEVIASLSRSGDFFGEMALIEDQPRSATARAHTETELLAISRSDFSRLIEDHPSIHLEVTRALSHNLRHSDSRFAETILEKNRQLAEALKNLEDAHQELLRRERLSLVGKLASGIIHDLKKPMTCISGYSQLLGGATVPDEKRKQYAGKITTEVQRLTDMINEILRFGRSEQSISMSPVNLKEWVKDVAEFLRGDFDKAAIKFKTSVKFAGAVNIDAEKFKNVFYNIASNALAAMPKGGVFSITCARENDKIRMDFEDNGIGMGEEVKARVFEDFFSQRKDGTGLGMAIVKRIVEAHRGTITVWSELGKGTRYTIYLPLET